MYINFLASKYGYMPGPRMAARVPSDWVDEPYTRFSLTPVSPTIGAAVEGVDLAQPLDDKLFRELNRALLEWKVRKRSRNYVSATD